MKKLTFLCAIIIFFSLIHISFAENIVSSKIKKVTLFTNQALVTRQAQLDVDKGLSEIFLETNAFHLDKDSVQAKVYGEGELFSVQFEEKHLKEAPQEKVKELEAKIEDLKQEKTSYLSQKNILDKQEKFLDSLIDFSDTQVPVDLKTSFPKTEDLSQILAFLNENLKNISERRQNIDKQIKDFDKELQVLQEELNSIKVPSRKVQKGIKIVFNSFKPQSIKIEANYLVYNCNWSPLYKINIPLDLKNIDLTMFSKISQKTGEDWDDVKLIISNMIPIRGLRLPHLHDWILDTAKKPALGARGAKHKFMDVKRESMVQEAEAPSASFKQAKKSKLPLSFEYELLQKVTIESKDKETILPLLSKDIKGKFFHRVVPKINPITFLVCEITADKELLSGPLNVYFANRFIGQTYLAEKKAGENFFLNLGPDRAVKVKREKIKDKVDETFFGQVERKTIVRNLEFKITIENLKDDSVKIKVLDNIPVSRTDKIEVKNVVFNPTPDKINYEDREGINLWDLKINPKATKEINIKFQVTYPKDTPVYGL